MTTRDQVIAIISEVLEVPRDEIRPETDFVADLGTTSLDIVNLIWRVEDEFGLGETPESAMESLRTVSELIDLVEGLREPSEVYEGGDVAIASDHAGVDLKAFLGTWLRGTDRAVMDLGPPDTRAVDYPSFAQRLCERVVRGDVPYGILICGSGIGMSIAANKVPGIRAALVNEPVSAVMSRKHNNANVLCLGARMTGPDLAAECVKAFLSTSFDPGDDGRHRRRVQMLSELENT
jgi:ribose 5-phosphate isomerase B